MLIYIGFVCKSLEKSQYLVNYAATFGMAPRGFKIPPNKDGSYDNGIPYVRL